MFKEMPFSVFVLLPFEFSIYTQRASNRGDNLKYLLFFLLTFIFSETYANDNLKDLSHELKNARNVASDNSQPVYEKLGLKKGEAISNIHGEAVDSPQKAMELYQELKESGELDVEIDREDLWYL